MLVLNYYKQGNYIKIAQRNSRSVKKSINIFALSHNVNVKRLYFTFMGKQSLTSQYALIDRDNRDYLLSLLLEL